VRQPNQKLNHMAVEKFKDYQLMNLAVEPRGNSVLKSIEHLEREKSYDHLESQEVKDKSPKALAPIVSRNFPPGKNNMQLLSLSNLGNKTNRSLRKEKEKEN